MKAPDFDYVCPDTLDAVFDAFAAYGNETQILAGGQSLLATLNLRLSSPPCLIDINRIDGLAGITEAERGELRVGAMTRHAAMADPRIASKAPLFAAALPHIAHPAIRNRGTVGGSLALADPAAEWPACAVAWGGDIELTGPKGVRRVAASDFFRGLYETDRAADELVTALYLPAQETGTVFGFSEFSRREGDFAIVGIAATASLSRGAFESLRLVVFGSETHAKISSAAAAAARGRPASTDGIPAIVDALDAELDPMEDLNGGSDFKRHLARTLAHRVLVGMVEQQA